MSDNDSNDSIDYHNLTGIGIDGYNIYYCNKCIIRVVKVGNNRLLNIMIDIDTCIVNPAWEDKSFKLYYKNNKVVEINSDIKDCDSYISTFCFDFNKNKLYKTSGCKANYKVIKC